MLLGVTTAWLSGAFARQAAGRPSGPRWNGTSELQDKTPASVMRAIADDATFDRRRRARAIFSLFANYLRPPQVAAGIGGVLGHPAWLASARLDGVYALGGLIPVELTAADTVFCMRLFPNEKGWSEWVIYFRLSGGPHRPVSDAEAFLSGSVSRSNAGSMQEFALCFPPGGKTRMGRIERFSAEGISVFLPG
jgi:hypothetical protein